MGRVGFRLSGLCNLHLIHTDSLSLTQTRILETDSRRFAQIQPVPLRCIHIHSISFRFAQSHSDPPNLTRIKDPLRSAQPQSNSIRFMRPHTDLLRFMQFHPDSLTFRFTKFDAVSYRFTQNHSNSFRSLQPHSNSLRFT